MPRIFLVNILYREVSTAEGSSAIYDATLLMVKEHVGGDQAVIKKHQNERVGRYTAP